MLEPLARPHSGAFGPNAWLVDDMYEQYRQDPSSVSESWRDFFADYAKAAIGRVAPPAGSSGRLETSRPLATAESDMADARPSGDNGQQPQPGREQGAATFRLNSAPPPAVSTSTSASRNALAPPESPSTSPKPAASEHPQPALIRGAAARLVENMDASLSVPTATSVRDIPARLLEVNREIINKHLARTGGGKISFTHLIGFAIVRATVDVPAMRTTFVPDADGAGTPGVIKHEHVGLGLAVDIERANGSHALMVPCIRDADTLDFKTFVLAYEDLVRKVRNGKVGPDDFSGTTMTLTNPGTIGTVHSVPRLMAGQGAIIGLGAIDRPAAFRAADPKVMAALGVGKAVTLTSTYDHRIIQGAESGLFLQRVNDLIMGADGFYDDVFQSLSIPYEPARWHVDVNRLDDVRSRLAKQVQVSTIINMYRVRGHLIANLDPLGAEAPQTHPELDPITYGLTLWDLDREFVADGLAGKEVMTLDEILSVLRDAYCQTIGIEYMHIQEPAQKRWIQDHVEGVPTTLDEDEKRHVLNLLNAAEAFERFLHTRYIGQKRFGLEGAEAAIVLIATVLDEAATSGVKEAVMGMAHRGRLNVLANIVGKSYGEIFQEFEGNLDPETVQGSGDVKYHKGAAGKFVSSSGAEIPVTLASNSSHLEAVDPVVEGMARAKQDAIRDHEPGAILALLVHGDAAFAGQGVVAETLNLSGLRGYRTGGTVHIVINNQLGFTTAPQAARTSVYPTDVAKMIQAPIIHVNGDDPEACMRAARLAFGFRQQFHKDVVIDMVCYRLHGHNEGDDPSYTQPKMYELIDRKRSVRKLYTEALVRRGDITMEEAERALKDFSDRLDAALEETRSASAPKAVPHGGHASSPMPARVHTAVQADLLDEIMDAAHRSPDGFTLHPKLARQFETRSKLYAEGQIDFPLAETLALGSILLEGVDVRLSGQDTRRGTFSQRHAVLVDHATGAERIPLAELHAERSGVNGASRPGRFFAYDSLLSEYAALGFEYGYSVEAINTLVIWEAQFGDFANGAEIIIDNFLVAAEDKWQQSSGLVLLLPHGYEGQGPEHSSARIERFLTLCADGNITVVNCTTAAQYFHVLRSQARRQLKRPLVIFTPKSLLRSRASRSSKSELANGAFCEVLDDPLSGGNTGAPANGATSANTAGAADNATINPHEVTRVVLCSGKVAIDAMAARAKILETYEDRSGGIKPVATGRPSTPEALRSAIVRLEQLYPWPEKEILSTLERYPAAREIVWLQEEPENMGPWTFVHGRLHRIARDRLPLRHVSRAESASPATGSAAMHDLEQADLIVRALG